MKDPSRIEAQLVWEWTADARREAEVTTRRDVLLVASRERFPGPLPEEVVALINQQESIDLLRDWFRAALRTSSLEEFLAVLRC